MPIVLPLESVPNQTFSTRQNGVRYVLTIKETAGTMGVTIERDGEVLVRNHRAVAGKGLIPYRYLEDESGNFAFVTLDDEIPYYEFFNTTQRLLYFTPAEVEAARNAGN